MKKTVIMDDKNTLLDDVDAGWKAEENLSFKLLMIVVLLIFAALSILLPKIYIKNQIYYVSRDISKRYSEYSALKEENKFLKQKVESMKFKNQVLDTIF